MAGVATTKLRRQHPITIPPLRWQCFVKIEVIRLQLGGGASAVDRLRQRTPQFICRYVNNSTFSFTNKSARY